MKKTRSIQFLLFSLIIYGNAASQNRDPLKTQIVTTDIDNFWKAYDASAPEFNPEIFQKLYIEKGTPGIDGFMKGRIRNAENLSKVISNRPKYYASIRKSTESIKSLESKIRSSLAKMKELYPDAVFPPVYFVVGALNSGGTASDDGLIIGAEMYGLTEETPMDELSDWLRTVIKPVSEIPHIVAHEVVHFYQKYDGGNLLAAAIKEGGADYVAELISGKHINQHVHDFANPRERELWVEFRERMLKDDYKGWLYSSTEGRPNDLGYWMGYEITKSYFDTMVDKKKAMKDFMNIKDFEEFLEKSKYAQKFD